MTAPQPHQRRNKIISFTLAGVEFSTQITSWKVSAGIKTGNRVYTYSSAGEGHNTFVEETDGQPTLQIKFLDDWRISQISDYIWANSMQVAAFTIDHHPDIVGEHVQVSGSVQVQAHDIGSDSRLTEMADVTWPIMGPLPTYTRIG
jgi:pterin-4a-carbinolamine dehydratase